MSITFACPCGKEFTVAPKYGGKRTKCPKCSEALYVPMPMNDDEASAYAMLADGEDDEPVVPRWSSQRATQESAPIETRPTPKVSPMAQAAAKQRDRELRQVAKQASDHHRGKEERSGFSLSPAVIGGLLGMIGFAAWFFIGLALGRIFFYPPIGFVFSLVGFVGGLMGYEGDD